MFHGSERTHLGFQGPRWICRANCGGQGVAKKPNSVLLGAYLHWEHLMWKSKRYIQHRNPSGHFQSHFQMSWLFGKSGHLPHLLFPISYIPSRVRRNGGGGGSSNASSIREGELGPAARAGLAPNGQVAGRSQARAGMGGTGASGWCCVGRQRGARAGLTRARGRKGLGHVPGWGGAGIEPQASLVQCPVFPLRKYGHPIPSAVLF